MHMRLVFPRLILAQFEKFMSNHFRHKVAHNDIIIIGTSISFISLLLYLNVDATLLQAVYILQVLIVNGMVVEHQSVHETGAGSTSTPECLSI